MFRVCLWFLLLPGLPAVQAETLEVVVGDTGCTARQLTVKKSWSKIPRVTSVTVLPRQPGASGGERTFVIVSSGAAPTEDALRAALARRAKHFPILRREKDADQKKPASR